MIEVTLPGERLSAHSSVVPTRSGYSRATPKTFFPRLSSSPCGRFRRTAWNFSYCCKVLIFPPVCLSLSLSRLATVCARGRPERRCRRGSLGLRLTGGAGGRRWKAQGSRGHGGPTNKMKPPSRGGGSQQETLSLGSGSGGGQSAWQQEPAAGKHVCDKCDILKQRAAATQTWPCGGRPHKHGVGVVGGGGFDTNGTRTLIEFVKCCGCESQRRRQTWSPGSLVVCLQPGHSHTEPQSAPLL